jgi:hypothetical protein
MPSQTVRLSAPLRALDRAAFLGARDREAVTDTNADYGNRTARRLVRVGVARCSAEEPDHRHRRLLRARRLVRGLSDEARAGSPTPARQSSLHRAKCESARNRAVSGHFGMRHPTATARLRSAYRAEAQRPIIS